MGLESGTYVNDLVSTNPVGATDAKSAGDDHLRLIKAVLKATFPLFGGTLSRTQIVTSGTLTAATTDNSKLAVFRSATSTMNLPAVSGLHNGWYMWFYADGVGVTIDPNGSEKVNGAGSVAITSGQFGVVFCTGVAGDEFVALTTSNPSVTVTATTKVGDIIPSAAATRGNDLLCNGAAVSRTTYSALFSAIGTTYGAGDASTTFNVPDLRGRSPIGDGTGSGLTARARGQTGGAETHSLSAAESGVPAHTHPGVSGSGTVSGAVTNDFIGSQCVQVIDSNSPAPYSLVTLGSVTVSANTAAAAASAHNNMQPFGVVNYFIVTGL